ncbi:hypothetical protein CQY20_31750 [Mycolicibacterium agri]|uniref:Uncharacterized protein n=1 Tax=Mycolicibacterium agri TaxID=36811 RepID=A0A2A7MNU4_MYCAG|nr:hypothetical protein [Mycolicibacterium agri]PEG33249.1 hypothetical protein CQY20_31750 [Mycolicibacterium agri]GFG50655.1 hypothetical protein MAGR_20960 [Mycolicibacterium agri]
MTENPDQVADPDPPPDLAVGAVIQVFPGTDRECRGVIADDFGEAAGCGVDIGATRIAGAARRWAVILDDGNLVFVDRNDIAIQPGGS